MEQIIARPYSRGIVVWASLLAAVSGLLIALGSPLFRVLGFEYAAISALLLSLFVGFFSAARAGGGRSTLGDNLVAALQFWLIPLIVSLLSLLIIPNCALGEGLTFYCLIALPTTVLAAAFGTSLGLLSKTSRTGVILFAAFWMISFIVSLIPGYIYPQLFTYGWQYGFFPGLIWDEYIELGVGYKWHLLEWSVLALILLWYAHSAGAQRTVRSWLTPVGLVVLYGLLLLSRDEHDIVTSHQKVAAHLNAAIEIDGRTTVHYRASSLTAHERELLRRNTAWYLYDIREQLQLKDTSQHIDIYVYPSTESLYQLIGTRNASIAKPWLSELHIARENLGSLKHELVHVLLKEWGDFPFNASWSTALTEGVAMALEPSYDGIHTLDEHSSAILQMGLGQGVQQAMSFAGFASQATTTSYVLSGSFVDHLLRTYGPQKLSKVYSSLGFKAAYGRSLPELETEWRNKILAAAAALNRYDSLRTRFYFERTSILFTPCLRRIGKLEMQARRQMERREFATAKRTYLDIFSQSGRLGSLRGAVVASNLAGDQSARTILDTARIDHHPQRLSLYMLKGDLIDTAYYDTLIAARLSAQNLLTVFSRRYLHNKDAYITWLNTSGSDVAPPFDYDSAIVPSYLHFPMYCIEAEAYAAEGLYSLAVRSYQHAFGSLDTRSPYPPEFIQLATLRMQELSLGGSAQFVPGVLSGGMKAEHDELMRKFRYWNSGWSTYPHTSVK